MYRGPAGVSGHTGLVQGRPPGNCLKSRYMMLIVASAFCAGFGMLQQIPPNPPFSKGGTYSYPPLAKGGWGDFHSNPLHHGTIHFAPTVLRHFPCGRPHGSINTMDGRRIRNTHAGKETCGRRIFTEGTHNGVPLRVGIVGSRGTRDARRLTGEDRGS